MRTPVFLLLFASAFYAITCKDNGTGPPSDGQDSTSHSIVWRTDTIGFGNSRVWDIAIINDDNIWAVGEFWLKDSTGKIEDSLHNVLRWDGVNWTPIRMYGVLDGFRALAPLHAIIAFDSTDILISVDSPRRWNGSDLIAFDVGGVSTGVVYRFSGASSTDLYMLSVQGKLSYYNGSTFQNLPTGVQSYFKDMWWYGATLYIGSEYYDNQIRPSGVFRWYQGRLDFIGPGATDSSSFQELRDCFGLWASPKGRLWALGGSRLFFPLESHDYVHGINPDRYWLLSIRGLSDSDVWIGGVGGTVLHWNGSTWYQYDELLARGYGIEYHRMAVKGRRVVLGGLIPSLGSAIITLGTR